MFFGEFRSLLVEVNFQKLFRSLFVQGLFVRSLFVRSLFVRGLLVQGLFVRSLFVRSLFVRSLFVPKFIISHTQLYLLVRDRKEVDSFLISLLCLFVRIKFQCQGESN